MTEIIAIESRPDQHGNMRRGDWNQCFMGGRFYPLDPRPEEIFIEDIAHALSVETRFGGMTLFPYSVAQHSVLVSLECNRAEALWGLLHDASEAYLRDIQRPLKQYMPDYKAWENSVMEVICRKYGLSPEMPKSVHRADQALLAAEARALMSPLDPDWDTWLKDIEPSRQEILPVWTPRKAEWQFLRRFNTLTKQRIDPNTAYLDRMAECD